MAWILLHLGQKALLGILMNRKYSESLAQQRQAVQDRLAAERMVIPVPQVIEDDPDTAWSLWQEAVAAQEAAGSAQRGPI